MKLHPLSVLIIEDSIADMRLIEELLVESGDTSITLNHSETLQDGIDRLEQGDIDVALLDLNLRTSGGLDTLKSVKAAATAVPIVVLTGLGDEQMALDAVRFGAQDYLVKGDLDEDRLVRSVRYAFERARTEEHLRESEARLRLLTEQVPAILWTTDPKMCFTSAVGRGLDAAGLTQDDFVGKTVREVFGAHDEQAIEVVLHRQAIGGEASMGVIDWRFRSYQVYVQPLRNADDRIDGAIGVALDITRQRRMEQNIRAAQKIQEHLLPNAAPELPGFDIAGACFPAEQCSGDYFDFISVKDGELAIVIADAVGHGFGPAILAATVRSYLRAAAMQQSGPHEMLTQVNWLLSNDSAADQYVTMFCAQLNTEAKTLVYATAGHQGYLIDGNDRVKHLESGCMPLGIEGDETFQLSRPLSLKPGDVFLLITDGILEARSKDGEVFNLNRVIEVIRHHRRESARRLVECLYNEVKQFARDGVPEDDITAVVVKVDTEGSEDDTVSHIATEA